MGDMIGKMMESLRGFFSKYDKRQITGMIIGIVLVLIITTGSILYVSRPEYAILYKDLTLNESAQAIKSLDELGVKYQLKDEGTILVPQSEISKVRIDLSMSGIPAAKFSYQDFLNNNNMFMSKDQKDKAFKIALENTLAMDIKAMPGVKNAVVRLSIPEREEFVLSSGNFTPKAAVWLDLENFSNVNQESIDGIAVFVSSSVDALEVENVTIHDSFGKVLNKKSDDAGSFASGSQIKLQTEIKDKLEDSLMEFLTPVFGYGNVSVMASVKLDFDTNITESRKFETPVEGEEDGLKRNIHETTSRSNEAGAAGVPGTDTNTDEIAQYVESDQAGSSLYKNETIINYELNETFNKVEKAKGEIQEISVAVIVNKDTLENGELSDEERSKISKIVFAAAGPNTSSVEIYSQSFNTDVRNELDQSGGGTPIIPTWAIVLIVIMVILPIIGFIVYFIANRRKAEEAKKEAPQREYQEEVEELELQMKDSGYKKSIENLIEKNPEITSQLLKNWLNEE